MVTDNSWVQIPLNFLSLFKKPYFSNVKDVMETAADKLILFKLIWFIDISQLSWHKTTLIHWNFAFGSYV